MLPGMTEHARTSTAARRAGLLAVSVAALSVVTALGAPAAQADVPGAVVTTESSLCTPSASLSTDVSVLSGGGPARVGQDFHVVLTIAGRNQCVTTQTASMNLLLPPGITLSPTGQTACVMFAAANPAGTRVGVPCQASNADNGYLRIDPQGAGTWTLARTGRNVAQVQLAVRAGTTGQRTVFGRVCDSASTVPCTGSPVADAIPFVEFPVLAAPAPPPAPAVTADRLSIRKVATFCSAQPCPDLATTPTSIRVQAALSGPRPAGTWRIQRRAPGSSTFTTIATRTVTAGSGGPQSTFATTASGLAPSTTYRFRPCFTPTGGSRVCGAEIALTTKPA